MPCRAINRIPKSLATKFGSPAKTEFVNWFAFKKNDGPKPNQNKPNQKKRLGKRL
jgi:hypothetical protein